MKRVKITFPLALLVLIAVIVLVTRSSPSARELSQADFAGMVQSNLLAKVRVYYPPKPGQMDGVAVMLFDVRGTFFYQTDSAGHPMEGHGTPKESPFVARVQLTSELQQKLIARTNFTVVFPNSVVQRLTKWITNSK